MFVIGTAGHVDHGKSTLIQALTGIDPDRLKEEKEREMTIDLGFAWLTLPSGNEVSIVDVPGHERFIKNMLAGVGGIDLALLVVAADESVMPQTREHLAILDLLQVQRGLAVVTKRDLVDQEWLELVKADVEELLEGTSLRGSPIVAVSSITGEGLPELVSALEGIVGEMPPKRNIGRPRLPVDRSFVMSGFGSVATGTLVDGSLTVGQEVELVPTGKSSRIRGLQTHRKKIDRAVPGSRVAVNLSGIAHDEIQRGDVLTAPGWLRPTSALDVHLRLIPGAPHPLKHNTIVTFHTGSSEAFARVRLLEVDQIRPGEDGWSQLRLASPLAMVRGDFFVIRSSEATLGGGTVVDHRPKRHKRLHGPTLERLAMMEEGSTREVLLSTLETLGSCEFRTLVNRANLHEEEARQELESLASEGLATILGKGKIAPDTTIYSSPGWAQVTEKTRSFLGTYHKQFPLRAGASKEELRSRLGFSSAVFSNGLSQLSEEGVVVENGALVRSPGHTVETSDEQRKAMEAYLKLLLSDPYSPPTDSPLDGGLLKVLMDEGKVVKVSDTVVYPASVYEEMKEKVLAHFKAHDKVTVGQVRDMFVTSRKYALAFLEHLDQQRITRRVGDERVLR